MTTSSILRSCLGASPDFHLPYSSITWSKHDPPPYLTFIAKVSILASPFHHRVKTRSTLASPFLCSLVWQLSSYAGLSRSNLMSLQSQGTRYSNTRILSSTFLFSSKKLYIEIYNHFHILIRSCSNHPANTSPTEYVAQTCSPYEIQPNLALVKAKISRIYKISAAAPSFPSPSSHIRASNCWLTFLLLQLQLTQHTNSNATLKLHASCKCYCTWALGTDDINPCQLCQNGDVGTHYSPINTHNT